MPSSGGQPAQPGAVVGIAGAGHQPARRESPGRAEGGERLVGDLRALVLVDPAYEGDQRVAPGARRTPANGSPWRVAGWTTRSSRTSAVAGVAVSRRSASLFQHTPTARAGRRPAASRVPVEQPHEPGPDPAQALLARLQMAMKRSDRPGPKPVLADAIGHGPAARLGHPEGRLWNLSPRSRRTRGGSKEARVRRVVRAARTASSGASSDRARPGATNGKLRSTSASPPWPAARGLR